MMKPARNLSNSTWIATFSLLATTLSSAQGVLKATPAAPMRTDATGFIAQWIGPLSIAVLVVVGIVVAIWVILNRRGESEIQAYYSEPDVEGSRFEQLLAEIQGLSLRVRSGESKGYYLKIEQLARVFLERTGHVGARKMNDEELLGLLAGGSVAQIHAATLSSIYERCRRGSEHEAEKLDFTAAELLSELREMINSTEEASGHREA